MLRLRTAPLRPAERLDFLTQGSIVHHVLAEWWSARGDIESVFERTFAAALSEERIPWVYHTERLRNAMLDDLRAFAANDTWQRSLYRSRMEEPFELELDGIAVRGKIDRLDVTADGRAYVIDYKYSNAQNTKAKLTDEALLQAPVYLMAAERVFGLKPAGMFYVGLKRGPVYAGWSEERLMDSAPLSPDRLSQAQQDLLRIVSEIRAGRIAVAPADPDKCRFCDAADVCRVQLRQPAAEGEPA
jgi:RecB family exonuclease